MRILTGEVPMQKRAANAFLEKAAWFVLSIAIHGILLWAFSLGMGQSPKGQVVKIELNMKLQPEPLEPFKPSQLPEPEKIEKPLEKKEISEVQAPVVTDPVSQETRVTEHTSEQGDPMAQNPYEGAGDSPWEGTLVETEIGIGAGVGGAAMLSGRFGREKLLQEGGSQQTEDSVRLGLLWLKRHQSEDGSWDADGFIKYCNQDPKYPGICDGPGLSWVDPGLTGLALLGFLGAGNTSTVGEFKEEVRKAQQYLLKIQDEQGCFGPQDKLYMYNHAIATLAMTEAYSISNYNALLKTSAQKAVNFIVYAQNPGKAWRYTARCNENDTSVTGWCVMALKSAKIGGLEVPNQCFEWAKSFLDSMTDRTIYFVGYTSNDRKYVQVPECMTAVAMTARVFMGADPKDLNLIGGAGLLQNNPPLWGTYKGIMMIDYYYWYYGTMAMFQMGGSYWTQWNDKMKIAIVDHQVREGCCAGSWPIADRWSQESGGRIYATAINVLSLEIYYRYAKVFK